MSKIPPLDKVFLEKLFGMESGYVLNFSDRTFSEFFAESLEIDIDNPVYTESGGSKAKRLRRFFQISDPAIVARALLALWEYRETTRMTFAQDETIPNVGARVSEIVRQLQTGKVTEPNRPPAPADVLDLVRSKTASEFAARDAEHERGLHAIVAGAAAKGSLRSGGTLRALGRLVERELQQRAQTTLDATRRVLATAKQHGSIETLKELVETIIDSSYALLSTQLLQTSPFSQLRETNPSAVQAIEFGLGTVRRNAIDRAWAELDLLALESIGRVGSTEGTETTRVLTTVLFTDIVDSTSKAAAAGDAEWQRRMNDHNGVVRPLIQQYGGRLIKMTGDGVLATFSLPGPAIRCALAMAGSLQGINLSIRAGLHTGELDDNGGDIIGIAVNMAQRVMSVARENEVLISGVVAGAIAGSGILVEDRGEAELKGFAQRVHLFRAIA